MPNSKFWMLLAASWAGVFLTDLLLSSSCEGCGIIAFQFAADGEIVRILEGWENSDNIGIAKTNLLLDLLFMAGYSLFLWVWVRKRIVSAKSKSVKTYFRASLILIIAGVLLDGIENTLLWMNIETFIAGDGCYRSASAIAGLKFLAISWVAISALGHTLWTYLKRTKSNLT
jgi:hypothetical protein